MMSCSEVQLSVWNWWQHGGLSLCTALITCLSQTVKHLGFENRRRSGLQSAGAFRPFTVQDAQCGGRGLLRKLDTVMIT